MTQSKQGKGLLFIISAPSGAGKTTLIKHIMAEFESLSYSVSHTSRPPRGNEKHGKEYFFISEAEFKKGIEENRWVEWALVHENYYGTAADSLKSALEKGKNLLLDIDVQGAAQLAERFPESITVFIMPPSMKELERRIKDRGTDTSESIEIRLENAVKEMERKNEFKHIIVNDILDDSKRELSEITTSYLEGIRP